MSDYFMSSPEEIADQRQAMDEYRRERELIDRFAECWRAIGQPETDPFCVVVTADSDAWAAAPESILGMPVFVAYSKFGGNTLAIINRHDHHSDTPEEFARAWRESKRIKSATL